MAFMTESGSGFALAMTCRSESLRYRLGCTNDGYHAQVPFTRVPVTKMTANLDSERFRSGAEKYAAYLETAEGRLRLDLAFANVQECLPKTAQSLRVVDLGCGTGATGVRLAGLGARVTLLDSSAQMLGLAERAAKEAGVIESIALKQVDVADLSNVFEAGSFDVILCHNVLEYVDDPIAVLHSMAHLLSGSSSILSVLVRNKAGEVLKAAIVNGDLPGAENNLTADWGNESLYGGDVRLFAPEGLRAMLAAASLEVTAERGVRVVSDYLPSQVSRNDDYARIFEFERKLGMRPEFAAVARYTHCLAHRASPVLKDGA
jgi:S-adenosylmethionine-dependent methyltransferase